MVNPDEEAVAAGLTQLIGKPFVIYADGKRREVGDITGAFVTPGRGGLIISVEFTDEEVAGILGAAQDKNQAAASEIGLSEAEIEEILADEGEIRHTTGTINVDARVA